MIHNPQERRRVRREHEIVGAALDLVVEGGVHGLTMKVLADRVDLTAGALYRYFPGKDAILVAMVAHVVQALDQAMERVSQDLTTAPPLAQPLALADAYCAWCLAHPRQSHLLHQLAGTPERLVAPEVSRPAVPGILTVLARLADALDAATRAGDLDPGPALPRAVLLWSTLDGLLTRKKLLAHAPGLVDLDTLARQATRVVLRGLGATPAALGQAEHHLESR